MKKLSTLLASGAAAVGTALAPIAVLAQSPFQKAQDLSKSVGTAANIGTQQELPVIVGRIINIALGFLGILFLVLILYAGFLWMTAGGEEGNVKKARGLITNSVIGLIIIVAAFAISNFVLGSLINVAA